MSQETVQRIMEEWPKHYDPKEIEPKWQKRWLAEEVWREVFKFREDDRTSKPYVIDTPPPFTSGELHMGHAYWVTIADSLARFRRMQGYNVLHPQGWDTQGLPTELKVQFKLRIPKENRELFLKKCIEWTEEMIKNMKTAMIRLGYRPEWERYEYRTYQPEYRVVIQRSLIDMYDKGFIEMREGPVYWCPKCETALAQSEVGYLASKGTLNYIRFKVDEGGEIVIATTRPELLPAIQAVAVSPKDERYKQFVGKTVTVPLFNKKVRIIQDEAVDSNFGTGAVMICTYGDAQDVRWQLKYNLPITEVINEKGKMVNTGILDGLSITEARKKILESLKENGSLIKTEKIEHNVLSHTERSDCLSPIEYLSRKQIYVKVLPFRDKLKEKAGELEFKPERMTYYLKDWIEGLEWDWNISRQRLYGTPLPFLYCDNGHLETVGQDELPWDPSRYKGSRKCKACGLDLKPVTDVADVWIDSSVTLLYLTKFYTDKELFNYAFPGDIRIQGTDIIRTWLFYTLFRTWAITGKTPFKNALIHGQVLGPDGSRMSKSKGNVVSPLEKVDELGADAIRMTLLSFGIGEDFPFKWDTVRGKKLLLQKIWNASRLAYPFIKEYRPLERPMDKLRPVDKWILAEHREFVKTMIESYDNMNFYIGLEKLHHYFWETVADEYLEMIKGRLFEEDEAARFTLWTIIKDVLVLIYPVAPHIAEEIYSRVFGYKISIELEKIPDVSWIVSDETTSKLREVILTTNSLIRTEKIKAKIPMNKRVSIRYFAPKDKIELLGNVMEDISKGLRVEFKEVIESPEIRVEILDSDHGS